MSLTCLMCLWVDVFDVFDLCVCVCLMSVEYLMCLPYVPLRILVDCSTECLLRFLDPTIFDANGPFYRHF